MKSRLSSEILSNRFCEICSFIYFGFIALKIYSYFEDLRDLEILDKLFEIERCIRVIYFDNSLDSDSIVIIEFVCLKI